jgi:hypothetical protein
MTELKRKITNITLTDIQEKLEVGVLVCIFFIALIGVNPVN